MSILKFMIDVICAPYSIPIGIINSKKPLDMCGTTTKKELKLEEVSKKSKGYSGRIGTQREDITSFTNYEVLNRAIQDILKRHENTSQQSVITSQKATVDNSQLVVPLSEDPNSVYDTKLNLVKETKEYEDGTTEELSSFKCNTAVSQETNITVSSWGSISEKDIEDIYNEVNLNIENTLIEQGGKGLTNTRASVTSSMSMKNILKQKIREVIQNTTRQNINASQGLNYIDRYGRCEHTINELGYWVSNPKVLKQTITLDMLSKNIIESTNKLIMNNQNQMNSKTKTVINRITNYRVIVMSLLCNVVICYAMIKMFTTFLKKIN